MTVRRKLRVLYDDFYYNFERVFSFYEQHFQIWKQYLGVKTDKRFNEVYKNELVPYWAQYGMKMTRSMAKHLYTLTDGAVDHRYIPNDIWGRYVMPHFNDLVFARHLADKNLNSMVLPNIKRPETLFKAMSGGYCLDDFTPIPREEAIRLCATPGRWLVKPAIDSFGGQDVRFFEGTEDRQAVEAILAPYRETDYIVQRAVVQHPDMAALNSSSVNTLRIITLVFQEKSYILSRILRVGAPGSTVDNIGAGGRQFNVLPDGTVDFLATNKRAENTDLPDFSKDPRFKGFVIPSFQRACETALTMAPHIPHLHLIGWDLAIDEDGDPVLLEFNARSPGQNTSTSGPTFGDMTDEVLAEVFQKKMRK